MCVGGGGGGGAVKEGGGGRSSKEGPGEGSEGGAVTKLNFFPGNPSIHC